MHVIYNVIQFHLHWTINLSLILGIISVIVVNIFMLISNIFSDEIPHT